MPLDTTPPAYTAERKALWDAMADFVRQHSAKDVLDAIADGFLLYDEPGADLEGMERIGRALERVYAENVGEVVCQP